MTSVNSAKHTVHVVPFTARTRKMSGVIFYYDIVCPFAYMSSRLIEAVGRRARVPITWRPVLLGMKFFCIIVFVHRVPIGAYSRRN